MIDFTLVGGAMQMNTLAMPGLPYYVGEVGRALPFADLTEGGGKALSTWVRGDPANIALLMYMSVVDADGQSADVVYDGALNDPDWQEWNVDMTELAGVDVTNAADIAIGVAGLDGGVVADIVNIDNIRVYSGRCFPDIKKPVADLNGDCIVDVGDLWVLIGEFGRQMLTQDYEERAAYWDERYRTNWASEGDSVAVRDGLAAVGYTVVNADELKTWMDARIADGKVSVVVLCRDNAPDTVVESVDANCTLRKYLDAGGKVVFYADIPFWDIGHADGSWDNPQSAGQMNILGIGDVTRWDTNEQVTITDVGAAWGVAQTWASVRATDPAGLTVLATDNQGQAAAYVKHFVPGDAARGFVRLYDRPGRPPVEEIISAAESKGYLVADLSGDGTVDWVDVILMLGDWLDEELWP
jgi:hypothetical protein